MTATLSITEPGIYDIPEDVYHRDPVPGGSLSNSTAKLLGCPAKFRWAADHPKAPTRAFDLGHAAHSLVLGVGAEIVIIGYGDYKKKAAQEEKSDAHARGAVPLLESEYATVQAMARAIGEHPRAGILLDPNHGRPEQSLFWGDRETKVRCRARLDWLPDHAYGVRMTIPDYKTTRSADPDELQKDVHKFGYNRQAAWYRDGIIATGYDPDPDFVFICQEKEAPYVVTIIRLDDMALEAGAFLNREARFRYRKCVDSGQWPGYSDSIETISLPPWAERQFDKTNFSD